VGRKIAITIITLLVLALAVLGYYLQEGRKKLLTDPYKAVSPSACFVIETADLQNFFNSLTTDKGLPGELGKVNEIQGFNQRVKGLADLLNKQGYKEILEGSTSVLSFCLSSTGRISAQLALNVPGSLRLRHLKELLRTSGVSGISEIKSKGRALLAVPFVAAGKKDTIVISLNNGLLVCNTSRAGADEAAESINRGEDVRTVPGFARVHTTSGKNVDKLFVIYPNIPGMVKNMFSTAHSDLAVKAGKLGAISGGDIYLSENGMILSGYTETSHSSDLLNGYKSIAPRELHTYKFLPAATVLFETMVQPQNPAANGFVNSPNESSVKLAEKLRDLTGGELTRAMIDIRDQTPEENLLILFELSNRVAAEKALIDVIGKKPAIEYFEPDEQLKIPVYRADFSGITSMLRPGYDPGFNETFFAFYDNYLIAGCSYTTVSRLLYDNILNKTLVNDPSYREFESTLPSRAGYYFYCIPSRITGYLSEFLSADIIAGLRENKDQLGKIQSAGFQLTASNGMIYNSLSVRYKEEGIQESTTEWETLLDTLAAIKPFFFTNHNTGAREIFIQDLKNNTYLINSAGRVLWKVPLSERITGNIYIVDYFRNGKYQLLFSGRNYLHLLDRNGNYVERFPVRLRSPSTNPLVLFDYDNNLNYRLFIAGEDKKIYCYDKMGSVVKGWKPFRTACEVKTEISYFKVSGKDYLVASDENSIYFLDRSGSVRLTPKDPVVRSNGSSMRLVTLPEPAVVCSAPDGTVQQIFFDGRVRTFSIKSFSKDHSFDIFDINGDGFGEYIFIDKGVLYLYNNNGKEIFSRDFSSENLGGPINFVFSGNDRKIGVYDPAKKLIYLISEDGKTMDGFPLRGASMFSIGKLGDKNGWHLIVGGTDRFLYNYRIESESK